MNNLVSGKCDICNGEIEIPFSYAYNWNCTVVHKNPNVCIEKLKRDKKEKASV